LVYLGVLLTCSREFRILLDTMPPEKNELRCVLEERAFPLWVLRRYQKKTRKSDRAALEFIIERWAMLDPHAKDYAITLKEFEQAIAAHAEVIPINRHQSGEDP
jgi:hypothetical protein